MTSRMEFRNYRSSAQLVHCNIHRKRYSDVPTLTRQCSFCRRQLRVSVKRVRTFVGKDVKRFYKNVTVTLAEGGGYEIHLDHRKLRTPLGTHFVVPNEAIAQSVALEWDTQLKTKLCNTAIDNPTHRNKDTVINGMLDYLETDTICYRLEEPEELAAFQTREWNPVLQWIKERYNVQIEPTTGIGVPHIPDQTSDVFRQYLRSYNDWALVGYQQAVESLKSFLITTALMDRHISVERAVQLSRVELDFQIQRWGNIEWHHDVDLMELRARIASATLFTHLNSEDFRIKQKGNTATQ